MKPKLILSLLISGFALRAVGQEFVNLDFESATVAVNHPEFGLGLPRKLGESD
jgi:hypothetical protein